jgi:uncharacterized protein YjdB
MMGVVLTTSDGAKYGMLHEDNLWLQPQEISFVTEGEFVEPHGNHVSFAHTPELKQKTITNITYLLKDEADSSIDTNIYVKNRLGDDVTGTAEAATYSADGTKVKVSFENLPATYTLGKVQKGSRHATTLDPALYSYDSDTKTLTLDKSQAAGNDYAAIFVSDEYGDVSVSFTVNKADQEITGTNEYTKTYGDGTFTLDAKATEGDLTYASSNSNVATVDANGTVTVKGAGTANITVKTEGGDHYNAAEKTVKITVNKKAATITAPSSVTKAYGSKAFNLGVKADGAVTYTSSNTKIATVSANGTVTLKGTGVVTITVASSDANYTGSTKQITLKVTPKKQSVKAKAGKKKVTIQWTKDSKATDTKFRFQQEEHERCK